MPNINATISLRGRWGGGGVGGWREDSGGINVLCHNRYKRLIFEPSMVQSKD